MVDTRFNPRRDGRYHRTVDFGETDYPRADYWIEAQNFLVPPTPRQIKFVVIHITGGPAINESAAINHFRNGPASAHYIVNREGGVTQMVRDAHIANHVDNIHSSTNRHSIGIEHVNPWNRAQQMRPTPPQYEASAKLVAWLCATYDIPVVHSTARGSQGIRGHVEEQPNTGHTACPNPAWEWDPYIARVRSLHAAGPTFNDLVRRLANGE